MLATKLQVAFFLFTLIFSNEFANYVNGVPTTRKPPLNTTKLRSTSPSKKSTARNGRFLGKFSILAGLGLPEPTPMPISRNDYLYEQRVPAHLAASYNFPPTRWGPYVAAVYEPVPLTSFLQNPLGYLANFFNPFNWLVSPENASAASVPVPPERRPEDVVVVVREPENEILNEERKTTVAALDSEEELDVGLINGKSRETMKVTTPKSVRKMKLRPTIDIDKIMDLIAEETTMKLVRSDDNLEDESRQAARPRPTTKTTMPPRNVTNPTSKTTTKTSTTTKVTTTKSTTTEEVTDEPHLTTSETNEPTTTQNSTGSATSTAPYPNPSYGPPNYVNGYYYGGYPQNVSHIELTTQAGASFRQGLPISFQSFNDINPIPQQLPNNHYDTFDPQPGAVLDYYSHFEQLQPVDNHYEKNERTLSSNRNSFGPNGFRPSYPVYQ